MPIRGVQFKEANPMILQSRFHRFLHLLEQIAAATLFAAIIVSSVAAALVA